MERETVNALGWLLIGLLIGFILFGVPVIRFFWEWFKRGF